MTNSIEIELAGSTKKFISVGNQTFLNSKGQTETCRKGLKGQHCQRHHGGSVTSFAEAREKLDAFAERTAEKLSPFENGCVWLYSVLMRIPLEEARLRYINATAMYALIGVRKPHESEVKGLQKILLKLADVSQVTSTRMDNLKRLIKKMTVGNGFSAAGFYSIKDMVKDSTMKLKLGMTGVGVAGVFTLTGCSTANPVDQVVAIGFDSSRDGNIAGSADLTFFETTSDSFGEYTRTFVTLPKDFKLNDGSIPTGDSKQALDAAVKFVTLESIDSIALDNPGRLQEWNDTVAPKYLSSKYINEILSSSQGSVVWSGKSTTTDSSDVSTMPQLLRDGGVRVADKRITGADIIFSDGVYSVNVTGNALVYSSDENALPWASAMNAIANEDTLRMQVKPDGTLMTREEAIESLKLGGFEVAKEYKDNATNAIVVNYMVSLTMVKEGDGFKIAGFGNSFTNTQKVSSGNSAILANRDKVSK